jgi:transcriptional regulator with XRE-family HTH domain
MNFASRLKFLREELNLRQEDLAKILNISRQSISNYEKGLRFPNDEDLIRKIAKYFNVSIDYLLGATNIRKNYNYYQNNGQVKENTSKYNTNKEKALENLFFEVDELSSEVIEKITEAIKLFKSIK